ncbi:hypothetical protein NU195Hw_g585t1 [Hortaea werneckii]
MLAPEARRRKYKKIVRGAFLLVYCARYVRVRTFLEDSNIRKDDNSSCHPNGTHLRLWLGTTSVRFQKTSLSGSVLALASLFHMQWRATWCGTNARQSQVRNGLIIDFGFGHGERQNGRGQDGKDQCLHDVCFVN